ncbi:hypothetical protein VM1G_12121 [Cytospora mali]|uniref:Uncharacterized protein n=1 Tax=Cytospora mali TaxID=578113 RepID=A0A194VJX9_CYTMA|nr:hypothetical protein VM1G_12121 [Valsa mali]
MIHGILQFTPSIAFCCVLHRCESRDIRCRESLWFSKEGDACLRRIVSEAYSSVLFSFNFPWRVLRRGWLYGRRQR